MGKVVLDMTMSLDGFIAAPDDDLERLHSWGFGEPHEADAEVMKAYFESAGAVIMGRGTFEDGVKKQGWGGWVDNPPYEVPIFVLSHEVPEKLSAGKTAYTFVTDGIESALDQAKAAAGDKAVIVMGGANIAQQYIKAGLLDEVMIHLAPLLLTEGKRLFEHIGVQPVELEPVQVIGSPAVTHIRYRLGV
jgi:dihydrofolate reductase